MPSRHSGRASDELRTVEIIPAFNPHAEGSALIKMGATHVLCTASVEDNVPRWMKGKGRGWVTAEYGMLPRSTHSRMGREAARGKQGGRTVEIQRLIGRSLRAVTDLEKLGERQVIIDCDVLQADGGTRTAAITGGWVALSLAMNKLVADGALEASPIFEAMAAVSCGIVDNECVLDLDYPEDSRAQADANFVLTDQGGIIEVQATAEDTPFTASQMAELTALAEKGVAELCAAQKNAIG